MIFLHCPKIKIIVWGFFKQILALKTQLRRQKASLIPSFSRKVWGPAEVSHTYTMGLVHNYTTMWV